MGHSKLHYDTEQLNFSDAVPYNEVGAFTEERAQTLTPFPYCRTSYEDYFT